MYLYLGQAVVVPRQEVVGVFDLDNCTCSRTTRDFLARAEKRGAVTDVSGALPKAFVICGPSMKRRGGSGGRERIYLSQLASATLLKRWEADSFAGTEYNEKG